MAAILLNAAYVFLLGSTFVRGLNWLRALLIGGALCFIAFGAVEGIRSMVVWNVAIGSLHLFRLARDLQQQHSVSLSEDEVQMRDEFLPAMGDFDFNLLWKLGGRAVYDHETIIEAGSAPSTVSLVLDGTALVERNGEVVRGLRRGALVGEMSFVSGNLANATVRADAPLTVHQWHQQDLASLSQVRPTCARGLERLISEDLVLKVRA